MRADDPPHGRRPSSLPLSEEHWALQECQSCQGTRPPAAAVKVLLVAKGTPVMSGLRAESVVSGRVGCSTWWKEEEEEEEEGVSQYAKADLLVYKKIPYFIRSYYKTLLCEYLDFFAQCDTHTAEDLAQGFEEGIAEGLDAEGVDAADALRLNQTALDAGNHSPDVAEGDARKQEAPEQSDGDAEDCRQDAVAPVLGHGEGGVAELPHPIQAVCAIRLRNDILKLHLMKKRGLL